MSENATVKYMHQACPERSRRNHLSGTSLMTDTEGASLGIIKYMPFGNCRNSTGDLATDKLFTGQRLDDTGLYYYGARYYDPTIGRFISPDPFVQWSSGFDIVSSPLTVNLITQGLGSLNAPQGNYPSFTAQTPVNPQNLNRYSYVVNNPLTYNDPYGWWTFQIQIEFTLTVPGFAVSVAGGVGFDDNGHVALVGTAGVGASSGLGLTGGVIGTYTNADTIGDLSGRTPALSTGVSVVPGAGGVLDYVTEINSPPSYTGVSGGALVGIEVSPIPPIPADVHAMSLWQGNLTLWDFGEQDQTSVEPQLPIESSESSCYDPYDYYWYDLYY
jgi:RHS repeat-associated protein